MTSISHDSTTMPRSQRDTRRMNQFVSIAAAVAGLLFASISGSSPGRCPLSPIISFYPAACRSGW